MLQYFWWYRCAFQITLGVNKTRFLIQSNLCECKYRLSENLCNSNQKWNHDECRRGCKELDD